MGLEIEKETPRGKKGGRGGEERRRKERKKEMEVDGGLDTASRTRSLPPRKYRA